MNTNLEEILKIHEKNTGKLTVNSTENLDSKEILSQVYTPGVAEVCKTIQKNPELAKKYTISGKTIAVISDGTAVLGLGNTGPTASLPVLEGKCAIFKEFAGIDAFPLCIDEVGAEEIIKTIVRIAPSFAAINLEDIAAPSCFYIEQQLKERLQIPVMHDDQHGTAIVVLAALKSALKLTKKNNVKIVISGAGAAGSGITHLLSSTQMIRDLSIKEILVHDSRGLVSNGRADLDKYKFQLALLTNQSREASLEESMSGADVFIGVSVGGIVSEDMVRSMASNPIIFALANPDPEIMPDVAKKAGAVVVATGRSDFPNQINNALAYPGVFKGLLESGIEDASDRVKIAAAEAIFNYHKGKADQDNLLPELLDKRVPELIAEAIKSLVR